MHVIEALKERKSVRAYTDQAVSQDQVYQLLNAARHAPSGVNTQPWQVSVVMGASKQKLQQRIIDAASAGEGSSIEYRYYPDEWREPYRSRRKACGLLMYSALGIKREDKARQQAQWFANYRAFDAPVMLLFCIDRDLAEGSYIDFGMFLQSLMLAAVDMGLATCPQAALAEYPHIVREECGYDNSVLLLCGMALGYEDRSDVINRYRTEREPVERFTRFFE